MRPQWIEGVALIAAHGFSVTPDRPRLKYWRPRMHDLRYALLRDERGQLDPKPVACEDLPALARAIERLREDRPIQLIEREDFEFDTDDLLHTVVEVWTLDMGNSLDSRIAVAWLNEGGRETLQPALTAALPPRAKAEPRRRAA